MIEVNLGTAVEAKKNSFQRVLLLRFFQYFDTMRRCKGAYLQVVTIVIQRCFSIVQLLSFSLALELSNLGPRKNEGTVSHT